MQTETNKQQVSVTDQGFLKDRANLKMVKRMYYDYDDKRNYKTHMENVHARSSPELKHSRTSQEQIININRPL